VWSVDGELLMSGSVDCTIRVWRAVSGLALAVCETGLSVQRVIISDNKQTIAAISGDCTAAPKLVMLHVTRTHRHASAHPIQLTHSPLD